MSTITKEQQQCTCHSYNQQKGETPNVVLDVPESIRIYTDGRATVCIDACIADAIKNLWSNGLPTLNSCCGHNKDYPEVVIPEGSSPVDYLNVLEDFDGRTWAVSRWERVKYTSDHSEKKHMASLESEPVAYIRDGFRADGVHFCGGIITAEEHERTKPALSDRYTWKHQPLYTAPTEPVSVPDESAVELLATDLMKRIDNITGERHNLATLSSLRVSIVEACHAAMLQGADGNSPVIPDGWVMVPAEPTPEMREAYHQAQGECEDVDGLWSPDHQWQAMLAAAPRQEVKP